MKNSFRKLLCRYLIVASAFASAAFGQNVPLADHHTHIWSLNASTLVTEPLPKPVETPGRAQPASPRQGAVQPGEKHRSDEKALHRRRRRPRSDRPVLAQRFARAVNWDAGSTLIHKLVPTAFDIGTTGGYIAGYEADTDSRNAAFEFPLRPEKGRGR